MSEAKHTPGPWVADESEMVRREIGLTVGEVAVSAEGGQWYGFAKVMTETEGGDSEEGAANLRLILAAPDLLAACRMLVDTLDQYEGSHAGLDAARAAIHKAEGK